MSFVILKQFIAPGQPGDPPWAKRQVYVEKYDKRDYLNDGIEEKRKLQTAITRLRQIKNLLKNKGREFLIVEIDDKTREIITSPGQPLHKEKSSGVPAPIPPRLKQRKKKIKQLFGR